ncbi:MAG TPA: hypothetical protein VKB73_15655, partial [Gaiellaceae bacterium]|nr:hypothetical protein [Gaiellaceae bacterium]
MDWGGAYAFPHSPADESRRLDPLTTRRLERLGIGRGALGFGFVLAGVWDIARAEGAPRTRLQF